MTETNQHSPVMPAAELQVLLSDLCSELVPSTNTPEMRERAVIEFTMHAAAYRLIRA